MNIEITLIVIGTRFGGVEAAIFILLTTLNKQLEFEDSADIYMFAKLLYMKRPGVFRSKVYFSTYNFILYQISFRKYLHY